MKVIELKQSEYRERSVQKPPRRLISLRLVTVCGIWTASVPSLAKWMDFTWMPWWLRLLIALGPAAALFLIAIITDRP